MLFLQRMNFLKFKFEKRKIISEINNMTLREIGSRHVIRPSAARKQAEKLRLMN